MKAKEEANNFKADTISMDENNLSLRCDYFECINCGYITYFWDGCIWRKGRRTSW